MHVYRDNSPIKQFRPATTVAWFKPFYSVLSAAVSQDELGSGHTPEFELITNPKLTCNDVITWHAPHTCHTTLRTPTKNWPYQKGFKVFKNDEFWFKEMIRKTR